MSTQNHSWAELKGGPGGPRPTLRFGRKTEYPGSPTHQLGIRIGRAGAWPAAAAAASIDFESSASQQRALVPPLFALAAATPFLCSRAAARLYRPDCRHDLRARGSGDWDWRPQLHGSGPRPLGTPAPAPSAATGSGGRGGRGSHLSPDQVSTVPLWEKID
jgi:hypothetical protein